MEENKRRVLFSCTDIGDGVTETACSGTGFEDLKSIITSILAICQELPEFKTMLHFMLHALDDDPDFAVALDKSTVDCPDFNRLLKSNDKKPN